ncbi:MAG: hypothetical protein QM533_05665 [Cytophagales bacterium]|nr:hypothetical protein [Cytophagales bacterium]
MLNQILTNTPKWVFVLFVVLVILGLLQMRRRTLALRRVIIVPMVFLVWSFMGVVSAFGWEALPLLAWALGYALTAWLMMQGKPPIGAVFDVTTKQLNVQGSALPLVLMMAIFFLKFFVGVNIGMRTSFALSDAFPVVIGLLYGACSGAFAGRAGQLLKLARGS